MKKTFFGLLAIGFISLSSFTTKESKKIVEHHCTYNMYNAEGKFLGQQTILVPDSISCGSTEAKNTAIFVYNYFH